MLIIEQNIESPETDDTTPAQTKVINCSAIAKTKRVLDRSKNPQP